MPFMWRFKDSTSEEVSDSSKSEYGNVAEVDSTDEAVHDVTRPIGNDGTSLHRGLKSRHITMIAIGGALGTGLIIGTGKALAQSGPGSILISYSFVGIIVYMVMCALGEMSAWIPLASGFTGYAVRFCDPALGFALGYTYWFKYIIVTPNQLTAVALVIQYWIPADQINPGVWITIILVTSICINYFGGVRFFGEFEFWLSSLKVIIICAVILLIFILACGYHNPSPGFQNWSNPGAFAPYIDNRNPAAGKFYGFWASLINAVFAYLGTELVGVTVGEAQNPRRAIPKAIKLTFYRILVFYILSVFFLGMVVPYNSELLGFAKTAGTNAAASPFVVAIKIARIPYLDHILNAGILIFVFSAANSDLYIATRTLYGLASEGKSLRIFAKTDERGVPWPALAFSSLFTLLAYLNVADNSANVFTYFVNLVSMFGLLTWISILVTHIWFCRAKKAQRISRAEQAYVAPAGIWGSYVALFFCVLIAITKNFDVFTGSSFAYRNFITGYLGIPIYLILLLGYKFGMRSKQIKPHTADFYTGKDVIDREEAEFVAAQKEEMALRKAEGKRAKVRWYRFISWLF